MARVRVEVNGRGLQELRSSPEVRADLLERGRRVEDAAKSLAPVVSGDYRDQMGHFAEQHKSRVVVHIRSRVPYAALVEARYRVLGRAIDAAEG